MKKIRFGIIGCGNQGSFYAGLFIAGKIENGEVVALCDINFVKAENLALKFGNSKPKLFSDYREMIKAGVCDAVMVETPHYLHPEISEYCLTRGVNVLCDKPAGVYARQVRKMNEAAEKSGTIFGMMFNQRTNCVYRKMREIIANGGIGDLQRVTWIITDWFRTQAYYNNGSWRATWRGEGGGVLINQCPHQLDLIQWVVGKSPVAVNGFCKYGRWHDVEVEDEVTAYLEYDNGATGVFITTTGEFPGTNRFEISGTRGKLLCENEKLVWYKNSCDSSEYAKNSPTIFDYPEYAKEDVVTDGKNPQHAGIINNFADTLLGNGELFVRGEEGIKGVELMNAIEYSGWNGGKKVNCPVNEDEYLRALDEHRAKSEIKTCCDEKVADTSNTFGSKIS